MAEETILARFGTQGEDALMRFMTNLAGSAERLKALETGAYAASKASTLFSQSLWTHPITTLKAFSASTEKAAIATGYFREQLAFLAASRFGSIILWGTILGGITIAMKSTIAAGADLEKSVKFVESAFIGTEKTLISQLDLQKKIILGSIQFAQQYEQIGTILWELKSAGLGASDALAGLETNQKLVVAGVSNISQATRLTAGIFKAYGDSITEAGSATEKFRVIGDTLAYILNRSQVDMDGLVQGFKYAISSAELAGISFNQLSAALGVLNNKLLFGTTAGTSLVNAFIQLSKNQDKIVKQFDITIDKTKTLGSQFDSIVTQLHDRFKGMGLSVDALAKLFESLNIRGGRAMAALISEGGFRDWKELNSELEGGMKKVKGVLDEIVDTKMDTLIEQWKRLKEAIKGTQADITEGPNSLLKWIVKNSANLIELRKRMAEVTDETRLWGISLETGLSSFEGNLKKVVPDTEQLLRILRAYPSELFLAVRTKGFFDAIQNANDLVEALEKIKEQYSGREVANAEKMSKIWNQDAEIAGRMAITWADMLKSQDDLNLLRKAGLITLGEEADILKERILKQQKEMLDAITQRRVGWAEEVKSLAELKAKLEEVTRVAKTQALENLASMEAFREKILSIKALNPAEQIERNNTALAAAKTRLEATTIGTKEWRTATKDLGEHVAKALMNYKDVNDAINKAVDSQQRLNQAVIEQATRYVTKGQGFQAEQLLRQQIQTLDYNLLFVKTDEQRLKLIEQMIELRKETLKINVSDFQSERALESLYEAKRDILTKINREDMSIAQKASAVWDATKENTTKYATEVAEIFKKWPDSIRDTSKTLNEDLNKGLIWTSQLIAQATKEMLMLATAIRGAGESLGDIEKQLERQDRRG